MQVNRKTRGGISAFVVTLAMSCAPTLAASKPVLLPWTYENWGKPVKTDACFQISETVYPANSGGRWTGFGSMASPTEKAFEAVLAAIVKKDKDALLRLSDPGSGRQPGQFDEQATAYFKQFETLKVADVPYSYAFGPFNVFFARLQFPDRSIFAPFVFHRWAEGEYGFLPSRTDDLVFRLLTEWFQAPWGPASSTQASYCPVTDSHAFAYRIPIYSAEAGPAASVYVNGAPMANPGSLRPIAQQVDAAYERMTKSLSAENWLPEITKQMDDEGAKRLEKWFGEADAAQKEKYQQFLTGETPLFIFDARPVEILFTRSTDKKQVHVLYFTIAPDRGAVWSNSSYVSTADRLFRSGPLFDSAALLKPFSSMENK